MSFDGDLYPNTAEAVMTTKGDVVRFDSQRERYGIGSAGQVLQVASGLPAWSTINLADSVLTTQGDVLYEGASALARLGQSTNNFTLATKGSGANPAWQASATSTMTAAQDILYSSAANTLARLAAGTDGDVLTTHSTGSAPTWETPSTGVSLSADNTWTGNQTVDAFISSTPSELTISSGRVTASRSTHRIDSEGEAATDTLTHMDGYSHGRIVVLTSQDSTRDITLDDEAGGAGTLNMAGGDFTLTSVDDTIMFVGRLKDGVTFQEISRSNNS